MDGTSVPPVRWFRRPCFKITQIFLFGAQTAFINICKYSQKHGCRHIRSGRMSTCLSLMRRDKKAATHRTMRTGNGELLRKGMITSREYLAAQKHPLQARNSRRFTVLATVLVNVPLWIHWHRFSDGVNCYTSLDPDISTVPYSS